MDFRVLGPLVISHDGSDVTVKRPKCQAFLAVLLSRYPHAVTSDSMADALWPVTDPTKALNSVRVHATYLRRALGAPADLISKTAGGYRIEINRDQLDTTRFEDGVAAARASAAAGTPRSAGELFSAALTEWRGEPFRDFPEVDALREDVARLTQLWLDTLEGYATVLLDDDRADEACRLLLPVVEEHSSHETIVARLMLALHRTGRQQDAIAVFARTKQGLIESGMVPTPQLQELANAIVTHDSALDATRGTTQSRRVVPPRRRARFIGREIELRALHACWRAALDGTPQLAYVSGDAGLGKTTLIRHFIEQVDSDGGVAFTAACDPDPSENYQPFPDLVRRVLAVDPPTDSPPATLGELARLVPDLRERLPAISVAPEPGAGRQRLFAAVAEILAAPTHPRLVVLEDLHWARPDAILLLRHVVRHARGQVCVLGSFRRDELQPHAFAGDGVARGRLGKPDLNVQLAAMDHHEVRALIDAVAPNERREEWIGELDELVEVSLGNPLRVREVLRQLELEPEVAVSEITTEDVRGLVDRRLRVLDSSARIVVQTAAVLGRAFTLGEVVAATGIDDDAVLDALEEAMTQGLVTEGDRADDFTFAHPLVRNAVYYSLAQSRRARIHIRCGDAIIHTATTSATDATGTADAARHYVTARPVSDAGRTAALTQAAGDDASRRYAHEEAGDWYRYAVDCGTAANWADHDIARLRLALGTELELAGDLETARVEYFGVADGARATANVALLGDAVFAATPTGGVLDSTYARRLSDLADEVLALLPADDPTRVRMLRTAALARLYFDPLDIETIAAEADRVVSGVDDPQFQHWALGIQFIAGLVSGDDGGRLALSRKIRVHTAHHGLVTEIGGASRRLLAELLIHGLLDEFDSELATMGHLARTTSIPDDVYWVAGFQATRELMRHSTVETEEMINAAALLGRRLQVWGTDGLRMLQLFALRYQQGRTRELTNDLSTPSPSEPQVLAGSALLALSFAEAGRVEATQSLLGRVVDHGEICLPFDNFRMAAIALFGGAAAACGTSAQRRVLRIALESRAEQFCVFGAGGAVFGTNHHWLARLAAADDDHGTAIAHLDAAASLCDHAGATFWGDRARREADAMENRHHEE